MKILLIDDDPAILEFIKTGLESQMFVVDTASDGERGSFMARTGKYDLIILDYSLPKQNGAEVLAELQAESIKVPVLILTVKAAIEDKQRLFSLGADDYLTKPFLFEELLLRIYALLKRPLQTAELDYKIDNLVLSSKNKIAKRGGQEIYLTRREFALLEYLMRCRGQIVSRTEILENVWDYNADPFSNTIEAHIASLRRKLNTKNSRPLIHTFAGRGYKLSLAKIDKN